MLWLFACGILTVVFVYGWVACDGDVSYGRLGKFPMPALFTWAPIVPPLVVSLKVATLDRTARTVFGDVGKAVAGLVVSVAIAASMPYLAAAVGGYEHDPAMDVPVESPD